MAIKISQYLKMMLEHPKGPFFSQKRKPLGKEKV